MKLETFWCSIYDNECQLNIGSVGLVCKTVHQAPDAFGVLTFINSFLFNSPSRYISVNYSNSRNRTFALEKQLKR